MILDSLENRARYYALNPRLEKAFDYLLSTDLGALPAGRHAIDGDDVFINVMEADLSPDSTRLEYHKKYADLQIDLTGGEGWGYTNLPGEEAGEFTGDIGFRTSPDAVSGTLGEGRFVLFFPGELHKPGVARPGCAHVRKVVIKIRMED